MINTLSFIINAGALYLLFRIWRAVQIGAEDANRKQALNETIKKFGAMFSEAAKLVPPTRKKKVVMFEADDTE